MDQFDKGFQIRGGDGVGTFDHFGQLVVEHYRLLSDETRVLWRSEPVSTIAEANRVQAEYRGRYGQ